MAVKWRKWLKWMTAPAGVDAENPSPLFGAASEAYEIPTVY